jgi:recombination protein RecA
MAGLAFLKDFKRSLSKMESIVTDFGPPKFWYSTGNLALNKIISGSFKKGIPQGRITCLAGPSGAGKSFILSNIVKNAQHEGAFVFMMDSEHALDIGYLRKIGVDTSEDKFMYAGVTTFSDVVKVFSEFVSTYEKTYGRDNPDSPPVVIALDSIDMLITDSENDHFESGVQKGDQGQRAKQAKHMLRTIVSRIKRNPMTFLVTHQVYPNTDLMNGQGLWIVNNAIRYSASQIMLIVPAKLKEGSDVVGVRMKVETYKSRFAQVGTKVEVEVPYASGMNPYSGFLDMMEDMGVVKSSGAWKSLELPGQEVKKFQSKQLDDELVKLILSHPKIVESEKSVLELMADEQSYSDETTELNKLEGEEHE